MSQALAVALRFAALAAVTTAGTGCTALYYLPPDKEETPREIRLVTDDLPRFYAMLDAAGDGPIGADLVEAHYYEDATPGLQALDALAIGGAERLAASVSARRGYYAAIRNDVLAVRTEPAVLDSVRAALGRFEALYPPASFPDVTFVVGRMTTGGTMAAPGLLVGVELFARSEGTPVDELSDWQRARARSLAALPHIVVHEAVHAQQSLRTLVRRALLARALIEGGADFVASLATGDRVAPEAHAYGLAHEAEVWRAFARSMEAGDPAGWFSGPPLDPAWPSDMGYFVGYRIAEAYHERADNKRAAIRDILRLRNPERLLRESGYAERFEAE